MEFLESQNLSGAFARRKFWAEAGALPGVGGGVPGAGATRSRDKSSANDGPETVPCSGACWIPSGSDFGFVSPIGPGQRRAYRKNGVGRIIASKRAFFARRATL